MSVLALFFNYIMRLSRCQSKRAAPAETVGHRMTMGGEQCVDACKLTAAVTALANTLAGRLSNEELNILGCILTQLADTLFTIAAQRERICSCAENCGGSGENPDGH